MECYVNRFTYTMTFSAREYALPLETIARFVARNNSTPVVIGLSAECQYDSCREFLRGFAEHGAACTVLSEEASHHVGFLGQLAHDAGPGVRRRLTTGGSAFAFCPREGGTEELSGVFGHPPRLASNAAVRALNAFTCASNSLMRWSPPATCAISPSIRAATPPVGLHQCPANQSLYAAWRA
jgi:hypothetical protein